MNVSTWVLPAGATVRRRSSWSGVQEHSRKVRPFRATRDVRGGRQVTIPLHVLLQWDDEGNDRQMALDLFDAFGSTEKTLHANLGGHTGVPSLEADASAQFFARHLS